MKTFNIEDTAMILIDHQVGTKRVFEKSLRWYQNTRSPLKSGNQNPSHSPPF